MATNIKFVCCDFDGVFTDGTIQFNAQGEIIKSYNVKDGYGIRYLQKLGIKTGVISSYIHNESCKKICEHLGFDRVEIGAENKLDVLNRWIDELDIKLEEVAYIGDDIGDLEILNVVGLSGCPNDAVDECKNVVNMICKKKGGEGCVREFIDHILNIKEDLFFNLKKELSHQIKNFPMNDINFYVNLLTNFHCNVYFTGVGKSKNMAQHTIDILRSIGLNTFYLDPINSSHGDIGPLTCNDIVFMYSKSGNTDELMSLAQYLNNRNTTVFGIVCNEDCKLKTSCKKITVLPTIGELHNELPIPTNSCIAYMLFCNILTIKLTEEMNLTVDKYKLNHPNGNIGKNLLLTVGDIMITEFPKMILNQNGIELHDILLEMTTHKIGCCFFVDLTDKLLGVLTDGDIRRLLIKNKTIIKIYQNDINKSYYHLTDINKRIIHLDLKKYNYIPIIINNKIIGILDLIRK